LFSYIHHKKSPTTSQNYTHTTKGLPNSTASFFAMPPGDSRLGKVVTMIGMFVSVVIAASLAVDPLWAMAEQAREWRILSDHFIESRSSGVFSS
jgi:hypothetical protein